MPKKNIASTEKYGAIGLYYGQGDSQPHITLSFPVVAGHKYYWAFTKDGVNYDESMESPVQTARSTGYWGQSFTPDGNNYWPNLVEVV